MEDLKTYSEANDFTHKPQNYMALSIVSTILGCCSGNAFCLGFIIGIVAIYFSTQVNAKFEQGDHIGAEKASKNAKLFAIIALALTVLSFIIGGVMFMLNPDQYHEAMEQIQDAINQSR